MLLAEKCAGFPKEQCDKIRRDIMKRTISGGEAAKKAAQETRKAFVDGCVKNNYTSKVANDLYDKIIYFSGYAFNKAHAVAYAIDSFYCAWLMTYYEEEWLCSYLEASSVSDDKRAKAFAEVRALGYEIVPIDIKHATLGWTIIEGKKLMPSLTACKGVGESAAIELEQLRPFETIEDLMWDESGKWRCSKFNKKAFESLIKVGAFEGLDIVGEGKMFSNYHHMYKVIVENMNEIKKSTKKEPLKGKIAFYELVRDLVDTPAWTKDEKIAHHIKLFGSVDINMLVSHEIQTRMHNKGVASIDEYSIKDLYWFCVTKITPRTTKNGKKYLMLDIAGPAGKSQRCFCWGWDGSFKISPYTIAIGEVSKSDFGMATSQKKIRLLDV